mgnify:CR=1 FL=1
MAAERRKRAAVLESEGKREAAVNAATGRRDAVVLAAEGERARLTAEATGMAEALASIGSALAGARGDAAAALLVARAKIAQKAWAKTSFAQRRRALRILSRCTLEHAEDICRVSARDSGKTLTDAIFGEVYVSLEKLAPCSKSTSATSDDGGLGSTRRT